MAEQKDFKHIVRIANTDLDGHKSILIAMTKIKGIGMIYSNMICNLLDLDKASITGKLDPKVIEKINDIIRNPVKYKVPVWMMNKRRDYEDGKDKHIISSDLEFDLTNTVRRLQKIKCNRGLRHAAGLPLRGQRTKSNFRRNKGKVVGVKRKKGAKSGRV